MFIYTHYVKLDTKMHLVLVDLGYAYEGPKLKLNWAIYMTGQWPSVCGVCYCLTFHHCDRGLESLSGPMCMYLPYFGCVT